MSSKQQSINRKNADNIYTYVREYADRLFEESALNEADNLVFSVLAYLDLSEVIPSSIGREISLRKAAQAYFRLHPFPRSSKDDGSNSSDALQLLFLRMARAPRYREMMLSGYKEILDPLKWEQFTAMCIRYTKKHVYVVYRGTSDSLIGWKEDFLLAASGRIPSQADALRYLKRAFIRYPGCRFDVGGHSKGGHLALYASVLAPAPIRKRISAVWSNDGPDLDETWREREGYLELQERIRLYVPVDSIASMIYSHGEHYKVVAASAKGVRSHDAKTWIIENGRFVQLPDRNPRTFRLEKKIRGWMEGLEQEDRLHFVQVFFDVLEATGADTFPKVLELGRKALAAAFQEFRRKSRRDRKRLREFVFLLIDAVRS